MHSSSRRTHLRHLALTLVATQGMLRSQRVFGIEDDPHYPSQSETDTIADISQQFMRRFEVPALSLAVAHHGKMLCQVGFGYADIGRRERVTPSHLFRIASARKPITSAAVFSLIEQGKFGLDDIVFGDNGILTADFGANIPDQVRQITVRHLLTHTSGGWGNGGGDPMFSNLSMTQRQLVEWTLRTRPLEFAPGAHFAYSNFGYCVLGRLIEKISGKGYAEFVRQAILTRCGIGTMRIAGNTQDDRAKDEVIYYGRNNENPYSMNISRMDSHGGWIAAPTDLVRFAMHVDGFHTTPNLLRAETIELMTAPGKVNPNYACGWAVNKVPNWWHIGSLPGTTSIVVRTASGFCWAACANSRSEGMDRAIDDLMWTIVRTVPMWRS